MSTETYSIKLFSHDLTVLCIEIEVFETSSNGNKLTKLNEFAVKQNSSTVKILPEKTFQTITGFGGSFTESSAYLLNKLSKVNRQKVLEAYFGDEGARYSLSQIWCC